VIWLNIKDDLRRYIAEDTYKSIKNHLEFYINSYNSFFDKYGIKIKREGTVTLQYSSKWILYTLLNNCLDKNNNLKMQIGVEKFFEEPSLNYFKKFLELDTKIRILMDSKVEKKIIEDLLDNYGEKLELRWFSEDVSVTLRNYVFGKEFAVDGIKILPDNNHEPSYIGTAYVNLDDVQIIDNKFDNLWNLAKPFDKNNC
jgi:hypothetical protein